MEDDTTFMKFIYWLTNNKGRLIFITIIGILLIICISFFSKNALVLVDVSASFKTSSITTYAASAGPTVKVGATGLLVVPRKTTSLIVTSGDYIKTESKLDIPWYGITDKKVTLQRDKNATKVAYKSTVGAACASYNQTLDRLAYYACSNQKNIVTYQTPPTSDWGSKEIAKLSYPSGKALPYLGGVIGLSYQSEDTDSSVPGNIIAVDGSGKVQVLNSPDTIVNMSDFNRSGLFTNTNNPTDKRFVIVTVNGDIYIGTPTGGREVTYHRIAAPLNYNVDYNQTLCSFSGETVYCYRGKTSYGEVPIGDASPDSNLSKVIGSQVVSYSFTNNTEKTANIAQDLFNLKDFVTTTNGRIFASYYKELYEFVKKGDAYEVVRISQNADFIAGGDHLYYIQDDGVYVVDTASSTDSHQVFYSKNIVPKSLYIVSDKVFIIGSNPTDDTITYAYLLGTDDNITPGTRLIDLFPMSNNDLNGTYGNDLVGNKLFVLLNINYTKDSKQIDAGEVTEKKNIVTDRILSSGVQIDADNIQFSY